MELAQFNLLNWKSIAMLMPILCTMLLLVNSFRHGKERQTLSWLLLFALSGSITATPMIIGFAGAYDRWPNLTFLPTDMTLFFGPLLICQGKSLMLAKPFDRTTILWFIPGGIHLLYQIATFTLFDDYQSKWTFSNQWHVPIIDPVFTIIGIGLIAVALYRINTLREDYLNWLAQKRADEVHFDAVWFSHLGTMSLVLFSLWLSTNILYSLLDFGYEVAFWTDLLCLLGLFLFVAEAASPMHRQFPKMTLDAPIAQASERRGDRKNWKNEGIRIKQFLIAQRWFLEEDLTLKKLSLKVGSNPSYVSRAFNVGLGHSFSYVVNGMRVEFAKSLISTGEYTLIEIAISSGFGSKSSFNRAFIEHTKQSPSQYKATINSTQNLKTGNIL